MKDILFLKHEPLLDKFREMRAYEKKVKKAVSKKNKDLAERLLSREPTYTLDMLIRERYVLSYSSSPNYHLWSLSDCTLWLDLGIQSSLMHYEIWMIASPWFTFLLHYLL